MRFGQTLHTPASAGRSGFSVLLDTHTHTPSRSPAQSAYSALSVEYTSNSAIPKRRQTRELAMRHVNHLLGTYLFSSLTGEPCVLLICNLDLPTLLPADSHTELSRTPRKKIVTLPIKPLSQQTKLSHTVACAEASDSRHYIFTL